MPHRLLHLRFAPCVLSLLVAAAVLAGPASRAHATFAGENGRIAFTRFLEGGNSKILNANPRRGTARVMAHRPHTNWFPDFSPDGQDLLFTSTNFEGSRPDRLFSIEFDGSGAERLAADCTGQCLGDSSAAYAPDGKQIVFERAFGPVVDDNARKVELYIAKPSGRNARPIPLDIGHRELHDAQWAPDGERLAVNVLNGHKPGTPSAIYVFRADGSRLRRITPMGLNAGTPDWSPNGRRIVFNSNYEGQDNAEIYTVRPNGKGLTRVLRQRGHHNAFEASWSPNGRRIAFAKQSGRRPPHIWTMRKDGSHLVQVTRGDAADVQPDWGSRDLRVVPG